MSDTATVTIAEASHHGPIEEVFPDIFYVKGTVAMGPAMSICRCMVVIRENRELSLINAVRLNEEAEKELLALGEIKHLLKIGSHGMDNQYYIDKFKPTLWSREEPELGYSIDRVIDEGCELPFANAITFKFRNAKISEFPILLDRDGGILLTCDSVQNWTKADLKVGSFVGGLVTRLLGFLGPAKIGPFWLKFVTPETGPSLEADFERLLSLDFRHLLSGHGSPLLNEAKNALREQVKRTKF